MERDGVCLARFQIDHPKFTEGGSGRRRLYSLNGPRLKPIFDWAQTFERFWDHKLDRIRQRAESAAERAPSETPSTQRKEQP